MAIEVTVPRLGLGMKDGVIAEWYRPDGSMVEPGDAVYRLESEFIAFDVEAESAGLLRHLIESGSARPGAVVAYILSPGERVPEDEPISEDAVATSDGDGADAPFGRDHRESGDSVQPEEGGSFVSAMAAWAQNKHEERLAPARQLHIDLDDDSGPKPIPLRRVLAAPLPPPPDSGWDAAPGDRQDFVPGWDGDEPLAASTPLEEAGEVDVFGFSSHNPRAEASPGAGGLFGFGTDDDGPPAPRRSLFGFASREEALEVRAGYIPEQESGLPAEAESGGPPSSPEPDHTVDAPSADFEDDDPWEEPAGEAAEARPVSSHDPLAQYADEDYFDGAPAPATTAPFAAPGGGMPISGVEPYDTSDIPLKDPAAPAESAYYPEEKEEPLAFLGQRRHETEEQPAPYDGQWANAAPAWPRTEPVGPAPALFLTVKTGVAMSEARKMREQLAREWRGSGTQPGDEDIVIRAMARAATECPALEGSGDAVGLVIAEPSGERLAILESAGSGPFRDRVEALANTLATGDGGCACTLTSFVRFGIDEGTPPLPDGHALALGLGATGEDGRATLVLAYSPGAISLHEAAVFLGRVRELVEAPYALLAA